MAGQKVDPIIQDLIKETTGPITAVMGRITRVKEISVRTEVVDRVVVKTGESTTRILLSEVQQLQLLK